MTQTPLLSRLLDGEQRWGSIDVANGRYGVTRYRLVVYPPGLSREERITLRIWRSFPTWGQALWVTVEIACMAVLSPGLSFAISTSTTLIAGAVPMVLAGHTRGRVRTLTVTRAVGVVDPEGLTQLHRLRELAGRLTDADARRADGAMSAVAHEAEVWRVYEELAA